MLHALFIAVAFFGLDFKPTATTNNVTSSRIYPVNPVVYRMVQPDGKARIFELTDLGNGILSGPKPWLGVLKGNRIDIWADPDYTGGKLRTAFTFVNGWLRLAVLDGVKYGFIQNLGEDLSLLFPERKKRSYDRNSAADIWQNGVPRMRLWFANPNSTGAFLAGIALLAVFVLLKCRGAVRVCSIAAAIASSYGLLATGSRGALIGFLVGGMAFAVVYRKRLLTKRLSMAVLAGLLVLSAGLVVSGHAGRIVGTFCRIDAANATRLKIAGAAVEMFADAPSGWRGGEVPGRNACLNWYVFDEDRSLRTHIMSLAELGWLGGFVYLAFWALVLSVGIAVMRKGNPLVAAEWGAFGLAGCFNPVYIDWEVWMVPILSLGSLCVSGSRLSAREWKRSLAASSIVSVAVLAALVLVGKSMDRSVKTPVRSCGAATYVNGSDPRIWIVGDPLVMAGNGFPGREILAYYAQNPDAEAVAYVYSIDDLPTEADVVVVAGRNVMDYLSAFERGRACRAKRLMMLSPSVGPNAVSEKLLGQSQVVWIAGNLLAAGDSAYAEHRSWVKLVPGCERYVRGWLDLVYASSKWKK